MVLRHIKKDQLLNVFLRLLPLGSKLVLMLYMGKYFSLADMGIYGLVFGATMVLNTLLGQGFSYIVTRDIVHVSPMIVVHKLRDQALLNALNYAVLAMIACVMVSSDYGHFAHATIVYILVLTILEGFGNSVISNMNSLNQQLKANIIFFIRSGLWVFPVVLMGFLDTAWRTIDVVLIGWIIGSALSLMSTLWFWRNLPWRTALKLPIDWQWLITGIKKCSLIWLGSIGLNGGVYTDRFVVEHFLSLDEVGVITFYFSFASAMLTLMLSGVLTFAYPRLISMHRDGHIKEFTREAHHALWQVAIGAGLMAIFLAIIVPILSLYTGRMALVNSSVTLWLMLFGSWIRSNAETLNYILYARHQDRAIWLGNLMYLIPAISGNALLVPMIGLSGIGWATVLAATFLFLWRWRYVGKI